jgi:hypothetical protein
VTVGSSWGGRAGRLLRGAKSWFRSNTTAGRPLFEWLKAANALRGSGTIEVASGPTAAEFIAQFSQSGLA